eukprot:1813510-Pyramimonas_sp.AAC.1
MDLSQLHVHFSAFQVDSSTMRVTFSALQVDLPQAAGVPERGQRPQVAVRDGAPVLEQQAGARQH